MRRALASDHDAAVARRLELLTAELATARDGRDMSAFRSAAPQDTASGPTPVSVEVPGRHASRRPVPAPWVPSAEGLWRRAFVLGSGQLTVVAVIAAAGLLLTCWWLLRSQSHEVAAPVSLTTTHARLPTPPAPTASSGAVGAAASGTATRAQVVVDVVGKVRRPGIAVLRSGARVVDAIRAAGGARPGVDLSALNLARVVSDGEQIVVGSRAGAGPSIAAPSATAGSPVAGLVDINTADETTLESLPEVGPVTAQAIIAWRTEHGGFTAVSQLLDVDGIGDATLAKLTPYVTI
jgi:competence protein ComEA